MSHALAVYHGAFGRASLYNINRAMTTHAHREGHLTYFVRGTPSVVTTAGHPVLVDGGTANAVSPWQPHNFMPGSLEDGTLFLVLYIKPAWFLQMGSDGSSRLRFGRDCIEVTPVIGRLVQRVAALLLAGEASDLFDGYLYDLTRASFEQTWRSPAAPGAAAGGIRDFRVRNAIRLMSARLADDLALDDVARGCGLSRPHFYKLFREHAGITPNVYLNTLRMEAAIDRLTRGQAPVTTIGLDLGFASQASFTRFFTANVGIPPTIYRSVAQRSAR